MHNVKWNGVRKYVNAFSICGVLIAIPLVLIVLGQIKSEWNILDFGSGSDAMCGIVGIVVLFLFCVICATVCWVRATTRWGESMVTKYRKQKGNHPSINASIDLFFNTKEIVHGVWFSNEYVAGIYNTTTIFREVGDLIWAYPLYLNVNTLDAGAALALYLSKAPAYLKLCFKDRKCYTIQLSSTSDVDVILSYINKTHPLIVTMYTPELEESFINKRYPFEE